MSGRIKLLLLAVALVLPTILAYLGHDGFRWRPSAQKNYGELLPPKPLQHAAGVWMDGAHAGFDRTQGKWVLLYLGSSACTEPCRRDLYYMRQTRILQDSERHRLELVWVVTDAGKLDEGLLKAIPGLHVWRSDDSAFIHQFPMESTSANHIYLIDPMGNLMLRFPDQPDAKRMMKDIKLLLKASQIG